LFSDSNNRFGLFQMSQDGPGNQKIPGEGDQDEAERGIFWDKGFNF
jgi:hypothetical protein